MDLTPQSIFKKFEENQINSISAIDLLVSIIENAEDEDVRVESINIMEKIGAKNDKLFSFLENLLISDSNEKVRYASAKIIKCNFIQKALKPMKWAIQNESAYNCIVIIIKTLEEINSDESKLILLNEIKKIRKKKHFDKEKQIKNYKFRKSLKKLKNIQNHSNHEIAEILINFNTIKILIQTYFYIFYEVKNVIVVALDLSEIGWHPNLWKQKYSDYIQDLHEVPGLLNLKNLKELELSNNKISDVKILTNLKNLTKLNISRNKIVDIKNLKYFNEIPSLKYLDLSGNKIVEKVTHEDFKNMKVILKHEYF